MGQVSSSYAGTSPTSAAPSYAAATLSIAPSYAAILTINPHELRAIRAAWREAACTLETHSLESPCVQDGVGDNDRPIICDDQRWLPHHTRRHASCCPIIRGGTHQGTSRNISKPSLKHFLSTQPISMSWTESEHSSLPVDQCPPSLPHVPSGTLMDHHVSLLYLMMHMRRNV